MVHIVLPMLVMFATIKENAARMSASTPTAMPVTSGKIYSFHPPRIACNNMSKIHYKQHNFDPGFSGLGYM